MSYKLVIVESPAKSKTIEKYLGNGFKVVSSLGHIRDLATSGTGGFGVDLETFKAKYLVSSEKSKTVKELKKLVSDADFVYLATDPDREGEAISWHLYDELGLNEDNYRRVVFNEITEQAIKEAFGNPRFIDMDLVKSQEARRILDRIVGFKLSALLQRKIKSKSAGRVQSAALKLVVDRQRERDAFIPVKYSIIKGKTSFDGSDFELVFPNSSPEKRQLNEKECRKMIFDASKDFVVSNIDKKETTGKNVIPLITSTLQQSASNSLNFGAQKTMRVAQQLYEGIKINGQLTGLITYMRTDSVRLSPIFQSQTKTFIESKFGANYVGEYIAKVKKGSQDAHEAIRPTNVSLEPKLIRDQLSPDQFKLYNLIWSKTVSALMKPPIKDITNVMLKSGEIEFILTGSLIKFDGYLRVTGKSDDDLLIPDIEVGQKIIINDLSVENKETQPPKKYGEASLVKALEENGVGRPSTYASILATIKTRNYVEVEKKAFTPTEQGILTTEVLEKNFANIVNPSFTADVENKLDLISEKEVDKVEFLSSFYDWFDSEVKKASETMEKIPDVKTGEECPKCGSELVIKKGRYGDFKACSNFPDCRHTEKLVKSTYVSKKTGEACPECGGDVVTRQSRKGDEFKACSNFPKCKWTEPTKKEKQENKK